MRQQHIKKSDLIEIVKRRLGYPVVKVELDESQILDHINYTREYYIKWAVGQATQERWYTKLLSAGVSTYDLDEISPNIVEVVSYRADATYGTTAGGIHTLFSIENYMYNAGMFDAMLMRSSGDGYSLVSYHIAKDFLETLNRYIVDPYNYIYHHWDNTLEIYPSPPASGSEHYTGQQSWILLRTYEIDCIDADMYNNPWFKDYVTALCKVSLGRIRSKFANYQAVGSNVGLALDGDSLISEGTTEIEKLDERLRNEEPWEGMYIICG